MIGTGVAAAVPMVSDEQGAVELPALDVMKGIWEFILCKRLEAARLVQPGIDAPDRPRHGGAMNFGRLPSIAAVAALLVVPASGDDFKREQDLSAKEGKPAPAIQADQWLNTEDGKAIDLKSLEGKVVVIDFWGTW